MNRRKPTHFRNSLDLRDKVQVKILRKRLKLSDEQFTNVVRKSGNSISAITKEATASDDRRQASLLFPSRRDNPDPDEARNEI